MKVLAAACDTGGARALLPVAQALRRRGIELHACAAGPALRIWREESNGVDLLEVPDGLSVEDAARILEQPGIDRLLSAAGLYNGMEHTFRRAARRLGVRVVSVLDSWLNYGERFERIVAGTTEPSRPDLVCAIDERSREGLLAAGFSPEQVVVTGPPNLEAAIAAHQAITSAQREAWRRELGATPSQRIVAFFSEPFITGPDGQCIQGPGALMGPDGRSLFGYTAIEILEAVLEEVEAACETARQSWTVIVKPHPLEYDKPLATLMERWRSRWVTTILRTDGPAARWIAIADVVVGMMSIALLEAALAGKPTLSVEIGLQESGAEDPSVGNLLGQTLGLFTRPALRAALGRLCQDPRDWSPPPGGASLQLDGAAERVAAEVMNVRETAHVS